MFLKYFNTSKVIDYFFPIEE
uniref:Uncharacterized protein n=1 Tax=Arundo donax TaxID=35708 RepID=A0A0A8Z3G1_ARUDO